MTLGVSDIHSSQVGIVSFSRLLNVLTKVQEATQRLAAKAAAVAPGACTAKLGSCGFIPLSTSSFIYSSPDGVLVAANRVPDPARATEEGRATRTASALRDSVRSGTRRHLYAHERFLTSSREGLRGVFGWLSWPLTVLVARRSCHQRDEHVESSRVVRCTRVQVACTRVHTCTHAGRLIFAQLCRTDFPSAPGPRSPVPGEPSGTGAGRAPFRTRRPFLGINNRPFPRGLGSLRLSRSIFPDVSVSGCYYRKSTTWVRPGQAGLSPG